MPQPPLDHLEKHGVNTINVRLDTVTQLFNSIDPSPFHHKDLDEDAEDFIVSWAREFPRSRPLRLLIHVARMPSDRECRECIDAVHNYFAYRADITRRDFRFLMRQGHTSLLIGLLFLAMCHLAAETVATMGDSTFMTILREGLLIGGWVAMWRPLEIFLYDWWPLRRRRRMYEKMSRMDVAFVQAE